MPNKDSAIKRVRQNEKRRERNRAKKAEMRSAVKKVKKLAAAKEVAPLVDAVKTAQSRLDKAAKTNLIKKRTASRTVSRLTKVAKKAVA